MHWLTYADPPVPWTATVALIDPDMFFLRPLWHDSFDAPAKYLVSGAAKRTPVPPRVMKGVRRRRHWLGLLPTLKLRTNTIFKLFFFFFSYTFYPNPNPLPFTVTP